MWDYSKLTGRIIEIFGTQQKFAKAMKLSEHSVSEKLNSKKGWKQMEIHRACTILRIEAAEIPIYFFTPKVQKI